MSEFLFMTCFIASFVTSLFGIENPAMLFLLAGSIFYLAYVIEKKARQVDRNEID